MSLRLGSSARRRHGGIRLAVFACLLASSAVAAEADPADAPTPEEPNAAEARVVELNERGSSLYAEGDYRRAVELFLQAYAVDRDPNLLFNIAACYEGLGDREGALEKYRAFLDDPSADAEGRPRAEGAIARLLATQDVPPKAPLEPLVTPAAMATLARPAQSPPLATPATGPETSSTPEWLPWAVLGGGAALGVTGVAIYLMGAADHREVTDAAGYDDPNGVVHSSREEAQALVDSGDTKKWVGVTTAAVGGAAIVGYLVWRVLEPSDEQGGGPPVDVALSPSSGSIVWAGRF